MCQKRLLSWNLKGVIFNFSTNFPLDKLCPKFCYKITAPPPRPGVVKDNSLLPVTRKRTLLTRSLSVPTKKTKNRKYFELVSLHVLCSVLYPQLPFCFLSSFYTNSIDTHVTVPIDVLIALLMFLPSPFFCISIWVIHAYVYVYFLPLPHSYTTIAISICIYVTILSNCPLTIWKFQL